MKALLLIGGLATRLLPLSKRLPKSLLPVCDREVIHYQITQLALAGIQDIILAAGHHVDTLEQYVSHYAGGLRFHLSLEPEPRGTAGAIAEAREFIGDDAVVVLNADILSSINVKDLIERHLEGKRVATLTGHPVADPSRYGLLRVAGDAVEGFSEKPEGALEQGPYFVNAGAYVLEPEAVANIPSGRQVSIERQTFPSLIAQHGSLTHFPHEGLWVDIGTFESYFNANFRLLMRRFALGEDWLWGGRNDCSIFKDLVYLHRSAALGDKVDLFHRVIVMAGSVIGEQCTLRNCLLMPGAQVEARAQVTDCIVGPGAVVRADSAMANVVLIDKEEDTPFYPEAWDATGPAALAL